MIAVAAIILALVIIFSVVSNINGHFHRKPYLFILLGIFVGVLGAFLAFSFESLGSKHGVALVFPYYELAADIITIIIASLSGSLIVSAILIQSERAHRNEVKGAEEVLIRTQKLKEMVIKNDIDFKEKSKDMSDIEFWEKYYNIQDQKFHSTLEHLEAKNKVENITP
ncbi:hypothetical protein [uncultured Psychromonas sp.]|uniref:hypothetical protein n=1 Tax=uncultured Psychromonas sp. TaxID=173974 RepID=UPI00262FF4A1|nr:hypothetical protein [uncultured Psychromonas sp.]